MIHGLLLPLVPAETKEHRALGAKACHPDRAVGEWRDLVLAFGKARQTLLFAK